jgi:hypothetical protein
MLEKVRNGDPIVYDGLPWKSFESHMDGQDEAVLERTEYGYRRRFHERGDSTDFADWRAETVETCLARRNDAKSKSGKSDADERKDVLEEIAGFDLLNSTPIRTMNMVREQQVILRNRKKAE